MKQIVITHSFQKYLKRLNKHFSEQDIINDLKEFARLGFRKGETTLKALTFGDVTIVMVKLRLHVRHSVGRYIVGVINNQEFLPIFIDLKKGTYGKNLSFKANHRTVAMLQSAFEHTLNDYIEHTNDNPRLLSYPI